MFRLCCLLSLLLAGAASGVAPPVFDALPPGARLRIGTARLRHGGLVRSLAFAPDGAALASVGHDGTVSLWEVPGGRELFRFRGHEGDVLSVAFSPDGRLLASGGSDGTVRLWAVAGEKAGSLVHTFDLRADGCEALAFDPKGRWLALGTEDGRVRLVGTSSLKEEATFALERSVRSLAWSHDGGLLAAGGDQPGIVLWDAQTRRAGNPFGQVVAQCLAFSPVNGDLVSWEAGGVVAMWDAKGKRRWQAGDGRRKVGSGAGLVYQIAFGSAGKLVFAGSPDGSVDRFTTNGKELPSFTAHRGRVASLAVSDRFLATGGADHTIRLWDAKTLAPVLPMPTAGPVVGVSLAAKGDRLLAVYEGTEAALFDRATGRRVAAGLPAARSAVLSPSGRGAWLVDGLGRLVHWTADGTGKVFDKEQPPLIGIASDAAGGSLFTSHADGSFWLRSAQGRRRRQLAGIDRLSLALLSPEGSVAAAFGRAAYISLWDARTTKPRPALAGHRGGALAAAFVSETRLLSGGRDRMLRLWDLKTGKAVRPPSAQDEWITAVAADPSGRILASATRQGDISLWSGETGRLLADLEGHRGAVSALALSADGGSLVSGGQDTTILVWDIADLRTGKARPATVSPSRAGELWTRMRDPDLGVATLAMNRLARDPARAWAVVEGRLAPVDGARIARLIARLDDEKYPERQKAYAALATMGRFAEGPMETALAKKPSVQVRKELLRLLDACAVQGPTGEHRQALLATDLLGLIATPDALGLLRKLAGGAADAELTRRAKRTLGTGRKR